MISGKTIRDSGGHRPVQVMTKQGVRFDHFVAEVVEVIAATFPLPLTAVESIEFSYFRPSHSTR